MDDYIRNGCLTSFVEFILKEELKEKETDGERQMWELWLHKVFDKTYNPVSYTHLDVYKRQD